MKKEEIIKYHLECLESNINFILDAIYKTKTSLDELKRYLNEDLKK